VVAQLAFGCRWCTETCFYRHNITLYGSFWGLRPQTPMHRGSTPGHRKS